MKTIEKLELGDSLFDMEPGESSMKDFIEPSDDFDVSEISSTSVFCEDPIKSIKETLAINGAIANDQEIKKNCIVTGIEKHSKYRWTLFGSCAYSKNRILINVFDVQFDR